MDNQLLSNAKKIFKELNLSEISIKDGECEIKMKRDGSPAPLRPTEHIPAPKTVETVLTEEKSEENPYSHCKEIKAPLVGVFYAANSPESAPFVKLGDKVKAGQTVCIIEAMKMMNEIKAEEGGVVLDICAENGGVVEFGQTLFKLG